MDESELLHLTDRKDWRAWLKEYHKARKEVWLVYYKKESGKPRIAYNDAVEEALCFGWIDSTVRSLDEKRFAQKFSPRKPRSGYSQANKERLRALVQQGKVMKDLLPSIQEVLAEKFVMPKDILKAIKMNREAWKNFQGFSEPYKRIRIAFIDGARKRPEEFQKRLNYFIKMTEKNKQFGFGGIDKHY